MGSSVQQLDVGCFMPSSLYSEGPTPGALQEMLDNIDKHTDQVRNDLFFNLMSSLAGSADPGVLEAMVALADVSSSSGMEQWVAQCANKYLEMQQHVAALQAELKAAQAAADLEATYKEFTAFVENGQYNDAAYSLMQLRKILEDSSSQTGGAEAVQGSELAALQEACASCARSLEEALESSLAEAFDVSRDNQCITITSSLPSGGDVGGVWAAMELAGSLQKHMQSVAGVLLQELVPHVLSGAAYLDIHTSGEGALLRWYGAAPGPNGTYSTEHVESQVMQLLSVLAQSLFRQQPSTMAAFGAAFWAPFVAQYQAAFLQQIQGSSVAVLQARQEAASSMEQQAVSMGLAEPGSELASCLTHSIQQSYHAVQEQFLAQARDLLLAHDPRAEPAVVGQPLPLDAAYIKRAEGGKLQSWEVLDPPSGWDTSGPVLATGYYNISSTALQMVMLIDDAMAQACHQGNTSMAQAIVGAVSKMAVMYTTMLHSPAAAEAPEAAMLRHNDLQYLATHLLVAPFLFDPELKQLLGAGLWFGNEALQLRAAARAAYNDLLGAQKAAVQVDLQPLVSLSAALASGKASGSKGSEEKKAAAAACQRVIYTLQSGGRRLWANLAPAVALDASQVLVEYVSEGVLHDVLNKQDIGERETHELDALYSPLLQGLVGSVLADIDLSSQGIQLEGVDLKHLVQATLQNRCHILIKAQCVLQLLQYRLADIVRAWEGGQLTQAGLSLPEVEGLVCALFEDTDYRAECLQRIEAAAEAT